MIAVCCRIGTVNHRPPQVEAGEMLEYVDPFYGLGSFPPYLFCAPGDWRIPEYQNIEWELLQLNNFFHGFQAIAPTRVAALKEEMAAKHPGTEYVIEDDGTR